MTDETGTDSTPAPEEIDNTPAPEEIDSTPAPEEIDNTPAGIWLEQPDSKAAFTPSEGFYCTALRVRRGEEWFKVLNEPPSWELLQARPAFYGNPHLFPYPYSLRDATFEYAGQVHTVRPGKRGIATHGLVRDHAWIVEDEWEDEQGSHVRASITVGGGDPHADDLLAEYPFPFRLAVTNTLLGISLTSVYEATNTGDTTLPMALGIHPYFPLPLHPDGEASDLVVQSNAAHTRLLRTDPASGFAPADGTIDMSSGKRVDEYLEAASGEKGTVAALYRAQADDGSLIGARWSLTDKVRGVSISVRGSDAFSYVLNFSPASREILSPVLSTCVPWALHQLDTEDKGGIIELESGETWMAWTRISVRLTG